MSTLPDRYQSMQKRHKKVLQSLESLGKATKAAGPLGKKTAELVQLAAAAAIRSEGSVHSHTRRALAAGATRREVEHALVLLTSTIGFPAVSAAMSWAEDILVTRGGAG